MSKLELTILRPELLENDWSFKKDNKKRLVQSPARIIEIKADKRFKRKNNKDLEEAFLWWLNERFANDINTYWDNASLS